MDVWAICCRPWIIYRSEFSGSSFHCWRDCPVAGLSGCFGWFIYWLSKAGSAGESSQHLHLATLKFSWHFCATVVRCLRFLCCEGTLWKGACHVSEWQTNFQVRGGRGGGKLACDPLDCIVLRTCFCEPGETFFASHVINGISCTLKFPKGIHVIFILFAWLRCFKW